RLLPHVEQSVHHVAGVGVVRQGRAGDLEHAVAQTGRMGDTGVGGELGKAARAGAQQAEILAFDVRLDVRQLRVGDGGVERPLLTRIVHWTGRGRYVGGVGRREGG